jgi:hypothetical protein
MCNGIQPTIHVTFKGYGVLGLYNNIQLKLILGNFIVSCKKD